MVPALPEFDRLLDETSSQFDPGRLSESHGVACGLICRSPASNAGDFVALLTTLQMLERPGTGIERALGRMFEASRAQLDDDQFRFEICLPPDSDSLEERTLALSHWCTGFLAGLGSDDSHVFESCSEEVSEALSDLGQIARAEPDEGGDPEEEEMAFAEIIEYLRVVTFMLREELRPATPRDRVH